MSNGTVRYLLPADRRRDLDTLLDLIARACQEARFEVYADDGKIKFGDLKTPYPPSGNYDWHGVIDSIDGLGHIIRYGAIVERIAHEEINPDFDDGEEDEGYE